MSADRYLEPAFIRELLKKAVGYYIGADQYKSSEKKRFPEHTTQDTLFQAIAYARRRGWSEQKLEHDFAPAEDQEFERFSIRSFLAWNELTPKGLIDILDELFGPRDPEPEKLLAGEFTTALRQGNIGRIKDIAELCRIFESKTYGRRPSQQPIGRKRDLVPWHYYTGIAAYWFLKRGTIPTRKEVEEDALIERAIDELPVMPETEGAPKGMRTDPEPSPDQDPESYYGADQNEPAADQGAKIPPKCVLSEEERQRLNALLRNRTMAWQEQRQQVEHERQQQRDGISSLQLPRRSREERTGLERLREQQIADKMEELRPRQPKNWRRIFKDLGLDQLQ